MSAQKTTVKSLEKQVKKNTEDLQELMKWADTAEQRLAWLPSLDAASLVAVLTLVKDGKELFHTDKLDDDIMRKAVEATQKLRPVIAEYANKKQEEAKAKMKSNEPQEAETVEKDGKKNTTES